jgi:uncharacterized membrane protein YedE/YeeE
MPNFVGLIAGLLFGVGLAMAGMTQPAKVIGFLDVAGAWDPSLAFVMGGAIAVYAPLYRWTIARTLPLFTQKFLVTTQQQLDAPLLVGAAFFGVGWGVAGFCPGPGIVSAGGGASLGVTFTLSMIAGMGVFELYRVARDRLAQGPVNERVPGS